MQAIKTKIPESKVLSLEDEYVNLLEKEKALDLRKREILDLAHAVMREHNQDEMGSFRRIVRVSYSWSLEKVRTLYPKTWPDYIKTDSNLLKEKAKTDLRLLGEAVKTEKEIITFIR